MTNAEYIRTMTDDELANFIDHFSDLWDAFCDDSIPADEKLHCDIWDCKICIKKWLEQERDE